MRSFPTSSIPGLKLLLLFLMLAFSTYQNNRFLLLPGAPTICPSFSPALPAVEIVYLGDMPFTYNLPVSVTPPPYPTYLGIQIQTVHDGGITSVTS